MKFVKRLEEIEAIKCAEVLKGYIPEWLRTPIAIGEVKLGEGAVKIRRSDGIITVYENDWVILDSAGTLSHCPSASFERLWKQVV